MLARLADQTDRSKMIASDLLGISLHFPDPACDVRVVQMAHS
jgi:hypothetical protein